ECLDDLVHFFDRWLKGTTDDRELAPVRMAVLTGGGDYFWATSDRWPPEPSTPHELYLDASDPGLTIKERTTYRGSDLPPLEVGTTMYLADDTDALTSGVRFVGPPLNADTVIAGPLSLTLTISSSTHDADIFVAL